MKGHDIFVPMYPECNTNLYEVIKEHRTTNAVPEWVDYVRTDSDGTELGFETKPYFKNGYWQGGTRWVRL